jgi:photosystem II stability/assembly factor-like uncharacterized protein
MRLPVNKLLVLVSICFLISINHCAQETSWVDLKENSNATFKEIQTAFHENWDGKEYERGKGYKQYYRWEAFWENRLMPDGSFPNFSIGYNNYQEYKKQHDFSFSLKSSGTSQSNWLPLGPFNVASTQSVSPGMGRVNVVVQDPNDPNTVYIGAPAGGVWKSLDGGSSWVPISDQLAVIGISGLAIDPTNSNIIYIATGDADGGVTYDIGIWKTLDAGETWEQAGDNLGQCNKILIDPNTNSTIWASGENGLHKSLDSGNSWTQMLAGNIKDMALKPGAPQTIYAASASSFYYSNDGGNSFDLANGLSGNSERIVIGVTPANSSYVYIVASHIGSVYEGTFFSADSGLNFTAQNTTTDIFDESMQLWYNMAITVSDTDENSLIFGALNLWRSTDGGISWSALNSWDNPSDPAYTHADIHYLNYYGGNLYCGSDGGIYKSEDNGDTFIDLTDGIQIGQFYALASSPNDVDVLAGGLQDNGGFLLTSNSWKIYHGGDGTEAVIDHNNSNNIFGMRQLGFMFYSLDGGTTVVNAGTGGGQSGGWVTPMQWDPNGNRLLAGFDDVFEFNISTLEWNQISDFPFSEKIGAIEIYGANSSIFYVMIDATENSLTINDKIYRTIDGGGNFTDVTGSLLGSITSIEVNPLNPDEVWATAGGWEDGNKVFHTENGGTNWTNISGSLPNLPANIVKFNPSNSGLYLGMDIGVYYRDADTEDWIPYNDNLPNVIISDIEINEANNLIRVSTFGRGVWESQGVDVSISEIEESVNSSITLYPNPMVESSYLLFEKSCTNCTIRLMTLNGQLIREYLSVSDDKFLIKRESLSSGSYVLQIVDKKKRQDEVILIVR